MKPHGSQLDISSSFNVVVKISFNPQPQARRFSSRAAEATTANREIQEFF